MKMKPPSKKRRNEKIYKYTRGNSKNGKNDSEQIEKWREEVQKSYLSEKETPYEYKLRNVPDYIYKFIDEWKEKPAKLDPRRDPFRGKYGKYSNPVRKPEKLKT